MKLVYTHWGTTEAEFDDGGTLVGLRPLAVDADPSPISQNVLDSIDHPLRIRRPAIREGFLREVTSGRRGRDLPRRRGGEPFVEVDWDEALDLLGAELQRVRTTWGNGAIFAGSYGWASAGTFHNPQAQMSRFLNLIGGFTWRVNSYSHAAAEVVLPHVATSFFNLLGNHTSFEQLARHGRLMIAFGGLPTKNQQVQYGGTYRHLAEGGLRSVLDAGVRVLSVSPQRGDAPHSPSTEWLPIRPGTDIALILGLCHTLVSEGLHNTEFLQRYCFGVAEFIESLQGCDATWAAAITGVPAERIVAIARDLAAGPSLVNAAWALQRAEHGEHVYWATLALAALLGHIGTPGGGVGFGYGSENRVGSAEGGVSAATLPVGRNPVTSFIPVSRISELLESDGGTITYDGGEWPLPETRLMYWAGGNPFHHHQDLNRLVAAWQRPECVVVHEQVWNPLARHADIVLPVTTSLEREDFGGPPLTGAAVAMHRLVPPPGHARDDHAIFAALAERFDLREAFTEGLDTTGWVRRLWEETRVRTRQASGAELAPFEEFWARGVAEVPRPALPRVLLADFRADPQRHRLSSPSGRIELHSATLKAFGLPPTPCWQEPTEWLGAPLAERFPLHMLSNQPASKLHSQLDFGRTSLAKKVAGREPIHLHPEDAAARAIMDGDVVEVFNDRGSCLAGAVVTDGLMAGVVVMSTGAWYDPIEPGVPGSMCRHGNVNVLTSARPTSKLSQGPAAQSCLVQVRRWEAAVPAVEAFDPPRFVPPPGR